MDHVTCMFPNVEAALNSPLADDFAAIARIPDWTWLVQEDFANDIFFLIRKVPPSLAGYLFVPHHTPFGDGKLPDLLVRTIHDNCSYSGQAETLFPYLPKGDWCYEWMYDSIDDYTFTDLGRGVPRKPNEKAWTLRMAIDESRFVATRFLWVQPYYELVRDIVRMMFPELARS